MDNCYIIILVLIAILLFILIKPSNKEQFKKNDNIICGTKEDNELWCSWGNISKGDSKWNHIKGDVSQAILTSDNEIYALDTNGNLYYRNDYDKDYNNPGLWYINNVPGSELKKFKKIIYSADILCGLVDEKDNNTIMCYDRTNQIDPSWEEIKTPEEKNVKDIAIHNKKIYVITENDEIYYKEHYNYKADNVPEDGEDKDKDKDEDIGKEGNWKILTNNLKKISFDDKLVCGVDKDGMVHCYDNNNINNPNWIKIEPKVDDKPIRFNDVLVKDGDLYGINKNRGVYISKKYTNSNQNPKWEQIPNAIGLKQIDIIQRDKGLF